MVLFFSHHRIFTVMRDLGVVAYIQAAIGGEAPKAAYTDPQKEEFDVDFDQI